MEINYDNLTEDQLEEWVEFIDWSIVPSHLLTENIRKKFKDIPGLQAKIWFEELFNSFEAKVDREIYPNSIFFFKGDTIYMELNEKTGELWCSHERVWSVFYDKIGHKYDEIQRYIKNVVEMHFKNMEVTPIRYRFTFFLSVEMHFKNMEVTPEVWVWMLNCQEEMYFKNIEG